MNEEASILPLVKQTRKWEEQREGWRFLQDWRQQQGWEGVAMRISGWCYHPPWLGLGDRRPELLLALSAVHISSKGQAPELPISGAVAGSLTQTSCPPSGISDTRKAVQRGRERLVLGQMTHS